MDQLRNTGHFNGTEVIIKVIQNISIFCACTTYGFVVLPIVAGFVDVYILQTEESIIVDIPYESHLPFVLPSITSSFSVFGSSFDVSWLDICCRSDDCSGSAGFDFHQSRRTLERFSKIVSDFGAL